MHVLFQVILLKANIFITAGHFLFIFISTNLYFLEYEACFYLDPILLPIKFNVNITFFATEPFKFLHFLAKKYL